MGKILTEITPLSTNDCLYVVDRHKEKFDFPIHQHKEFELNFVANCKGCQRVVGDSIEELDYYDLVIVGDGLEHGWLQNDVPPADINDEGSMMREITIQWEPDLISEDLFQKTPFASLHEMLKKSVKGIAFGQKTIEKTLPRFEELLEPQPGFIRYQKFWEILYHLSISDDYRELSSSAFAKMPVTESSRRVKKVTDYIAQHYAEQLRLEDLASMVGMAPTAFSRFFKSHTNQTVSSYIIDIRLGHAIRLLIDTTMNSSEICYMCGFNNQSNFNRLFKKKKGCTPTEFRETYLKTKIIV